MEITSFVLGVCAVIVLMMVVGTFVNYMSVKQLKEHLDTLDRDIHRQLEQVDEARGKQHFEHIDYVDQLYNNAENNMNEIYRYIDSRMDKLESKFKSDILLPTQVKKFIEDGKRTKERLDEFITTYRNQ